MKHPYEKSKDKYIAALKVVTCLVLVPFVAVYVAAKEAYQVFAEVARELIFERGIPDAYNDFMHDARSRRMRRERLRNQKQ
ncbi:Uncharacterised protein [Burkholderia pseudomallei]|nr:Uncharacterised protein [Burkholderia pseudomallei]